MHQKAENFNVGTASCRLVETLLTVCARAPLDFERQKLSMQICTLGPDLRSPIAPPLSSREYDAAATAHLFRPPTRRRLLPARLLGILSRQAGPALSLQVSRALFSARPDLLTGRFGWSFPIEPRLAVSPSPGLPGFSHWSRVLWVTVARSNFRPGWRV
jgi:hypothetical protein